MVEPSLLSDVVTGGAGSGDDVTGASSPIDYPTVGLQWHQVMPVPPQCAMRHLDDIRARGVLCR